MLTFIAETNYSVPYINTAIFETKYGDIIIDRQRTEWTYDNTNGLMTMEWSGCYIWDGETKNYNIPIDVLKSARLKKIEIEDDAPTDIFFKVNKYICNTQTTKED